MTLLASSYVMKPRQAHVYIEGNAAIEEMQATAEHEFKRLLGEKFQITGVDGHMDMIDVGHGSPDWLPGQWRVTFTAHEVIR